MDDKALLLTAAIVDDNQAEKDIHHMEVSLVTAPVQVQSISPLSSSGRVARFLGGSNRGCAGSEIARVGVESTKKPTPDVVVVSRRDVTARPLLWNFSVEKSLMG
ncbi:hypothetical protein TNCV_3634171 [Trichonephila clavipes]|nr:hypothetical protein TNCV_3634171 [Trichonephila clavipes]